MPGRAHGPWATLAGLERFGRRGGRERGGGRKDRPEGRRRRPPLELTTPALVLPELSPALDGLRIGHLSDVHVRTGVRPRRLEHAIDALNAAAPDLVALTGDYLCLSTRPLPALTRALRSLRAPAWAVLGNHDHWGGARAVVRALEAAGVHVLVNASARVPVRGDALTVVGVDDSVTRHEDVPRAFAGVAPGALVLAHDPKLATAFAPWRPALVLSGHTHGGQVVVRGVTPFVARRLGLPFLAGAYALEDTVLYVNRGLGAALPVRVGAPPEVAVLTVRSGARAQAA